jgi:hypothetical protein
MKDMTEELKTFFAMRLSWKGQAKKGRKFTGEYGKTSNIF